MWQVVLRAADLQPHRIDIEVGETGIGRAKTNEIIVNDSAASRHHAKFLVNKDTASISITDLDSTNGTYLRSQQIKKTEELKDGDVLRIGQVLLTINSRIPQDSLSMIQHSHTYTRELVLKSTDEHAILLFEVTRKLNPISDIDTAIAEIMRIVSSAMNVDLCQVVLKENFSVFPELKFNQSLANKAVQKISAEIDSLEMYVPSLVKNEVVALMFMKRLPPSARPFEESDLQLAVAISHQVALTLERIQIINEMREEKDIKRMLMRFFTPIDSKKLIETCKKTGKLPELEKQNVTILFSDIVDSTKMAEELGSSLFAVALSNYYQIVTQIVFNYGGIVKYLGDGILAIFPAKSVESHEEKAVLAARELIASITNTDFLNGMRKLVVGVSINTGNAMMGYVGTMERAEFNVLGDVVNIAFHLQKYARPNKIIVGSSTIAAINNNFDFKRVGFVQLKGRVNGVQAFEVLS